MLIRSKAKVRSFKKGENSLLVLEGLKGVIRIKIIHF
jgi:hypothetical protein